LKFCAGRAWHPPVAAGIDTCTTPANASHPVIARCDPAAGQKHSGGLMRLVAVTPTIQSVDEGFDPEHAFKIRARRRTRKNGGCGVSVHERLEPALKGPTLTSWDSLRFSIGTFFTPAVCMQAGKPVAPQAMRRPGLRQTRPPEYVRRPAQGRQCR